MNGSAISHNVYSLMYTSYKSIDLADNVHDIVIQNSRETHVIEKLCFKYLVLKATLHILVDNQKYQIR